LKFIPMLVFAHDWLG